jgi:DNA modification methylase
MILHGDVRDLLPTLQSETVDCVVTSPPYWQLRDYGFPNQIGLEPTIREFVDVLVAVFEEIHRILKPGGNCWVNLGDTYMTKAPGVQGQTTTLREWSNGGRRQPLDFSRIDRADTSLPLKSLCGIPWRVALAMQDAGWILREEIIWHKPNPMPESTKDRCTRAHEYLFHFVKQGHYFWSYEGNKEPVTGGAHPRRKMGAPQNWAGKGASHEAKVFLTGDRKGPRPRYNPSFDAAVNELVETRNRRSVWTIAPEPNRGAHFATFPKKLVRPCLQSSCPPGGVVLDPFAGTGTVGAVAKEMGLEAILIEGSAEYVATMKGGAADGQ